MITQHFILHMVPDEVRPRIYLSQSSSGLEKLKFTLIGTDGAYYTVPSGSSVTLVGSKPDRTSFSIACTYSGNTVTADVTEQMTAVPGIVPAELRFANTSGAVLPTQNMELIIERSPLDGMVCSRNDFISVNDEIQSISQDAANAKKYATEAKKAGEKALSDINTTATNAKAAVESTKTSAINSINSTKDSAVNTVNSTKESAVNTINSTKDSAVTTVNNTKTQAVTAINTSASETQAAFDQAVEEMKGYVENPVIYEYISSSGTLRASTLN